MVQENNEETFSTLLKDYTPEKIKDLIDKDVYKQDDAKKKSSIAFYNHLMRCVFPTFPRYNLLITGPSGCGKTEIWRTLDKKFGKVVPFEFINCATISKEGFIGNNKVSCIFENLKPFTIIVFDEFDKICCPLTTSENENLNASIQTDFLKYIEGEVKCRNINTCDFVFLGAFATLYEEKELARNKHQIGFNANDNNTSNVEITLQDMIDYGMLSEIASRISNTCQVEELTLDDYIMLAKRPKNALSNIKMYMDFNCHDTYITDEEITKIAKEAKDKKLGARWMINEMHQELLFRLYNKGLIVKKLNARDILYRNLKIYYKHNGNTSKNKKNDYVIDGKYNMTIFKKDPLKKEKKEELVVECADDRIPYEAHEIMIDKINKTMMHCNCTHFIKNIGGYCYYYDNNEPLIPIIVPVDEVLKNVNNK